MTLSQQDTPLLIDTIAGSPERIHRLLQELVELAGQTDDTTTSPVLELQLGDIYTMTSLSLEAVAPCLSITALLPCSALPSRMQSVDSQNMPPCPIDGTLSWDRDTNRYIMVRKIPIAGLPDERSVLDTILDTADQATDWFAFLYTSSQKQ